MSHHRRLKALGSAGRPRRSRPRSSYSLRPPASSLRRSRRGVLLLVVLSTLVLFLMIGTAFVIVAKQSQQAAKMGSQATQRTTRAANQAELLDEVLKQIVRGTKNPHSALQGHSLLEDMYGNDGLFGLIDPGTLGWAGGGTNGGVTGGQMLEFRLAAGSLRDLYNNAVDAAGTALKLSHLDNAYNGQLLTFLNGPAKGRSTRIVGYVAATNTLRVMNVELENGGLITDPTNQLVSGSIPTRVLINGRPFNGTGTGFNQFSHDDAPKLSAQEAVPGVTLAPAGRNPEVALLPNAVFFSPANLVLPDQPAAATLAPWQYYSRTGVDINRARRSGLGGSDESYDAADFQNMALGLLPDADQLIDTVLPDVTATPLPTSLTTTSGSTTSGMVLPSFHRPELLNYWNSETGGALGTNPMLLRKVLLRPNWLDHPQFTGSNPEYAAATDAQKLARMIYGPWDVDNDNDGVRDSVWVDVGLPPVLGPNGNLVKPLAAILVLDMDGRLNLNAHGTLDLAEVEPTYGGVNTLYSATYSQPVNPAPLAGGGNSRDIPRGIGFGPADISLRSILPKVAVPSQPDRDFFRRLLVGSDDRTIPGRYGYSDGSGFMPGYGAAPIYGGFDLLSRIGMFGWPESPIRLSNSATPPDLTARYGVGLNATGQPFFEATQQAVIANGYETFVVNSPYELNLSQKTATGVQGVAALAYSADAPYSLGELERTLRMFDADAGALPSRLRQLLYDPSNPQVFMRLRTLATTDSFSVPAPSPTLPHEMETLVSTDPQYARPPRAIAELFEIRVRAALANSGLTIAKFPEPIADANAAAQVKRVVRQLLAPELAQGRRLNVNRPLGNGRDDNGNGVVDEPGETGAIWDLNNPSATGAVQGFQSVQFPSTALDAPFRSTSDQLAPVDHRHLLARHLYVLALTLTAPANYDPANATAANKDAQREIAARLAQWAVNVVDFRDPDNICTAFEYDPNPFDGWSVDGWVGAALAADGSVAGPSQDGDGIDNALGLYAPQGAPRKLTPDERAVVWGTERPELLINEVMAWHDRRTTDESDEDVEPPVNGGPSRDGDAGTKPGLKGQGPEADATYDQLVRPRGAAFIELYNPWPASPAANSDTHLNPDTGAGDGTREGDLGVNLAAVSVGGSPVWRIIMYRDGIDMSDPNHPKVLDPDNPRVDERPKLPDRTIYFAAFDPNSADPNRNEDEDGVAFFSQPRFQVESVRPGRYLIVGSGSRVATANEVTDDNGGAGTHFRAPISRIYNATDETASPSTTYAEFNMTGASPSFSFVINGQEFRINGAPMSGQLAEAAGAPIDARDKIYDVAFIDQVHDVPDGYDDVTVTRPGQPPAPSEVKHRRFTISEPAIGYKDVILNSMYNQQEGQYFYGGDLSDPEAVDIPFDDPNTRGRNDDRVLLQGPQQSQPLFLQRLANPMLRWNPERGHPQHDASRPVNPYLTVDHFVPMLSVFEGEHQDVQDENVEQDLYKSFAGVERGWQNYGMGPNGQMPTDASKPEGNRLWSPELTWKIKPTNGAHPQGRELPSNHIFQVAPTMSLGFLNKAAGTTSVLEPAKPFPWLTFNNRPFVSGNELMLAPRSRSSQLLREFSFFPTSDAVKPYQKQANPPRTQPQNEQRPFGHLMNFYQDDETAQRDAVRHLYRIFDYVEAPSLFTGTNTWLNPVNFTEPVLPNPAPPISTATDPRINLQAPNNTLSEFRDPGRVNINTIANKDVWSGIFHGTPNQANVANKTHLGPPWANSGATTGPSLVAARRGYDPVGSPTQPSTMELNPAMPTFFGRPFQAVDSGEFVPVDDMRRSSGLDCGLFRTEKGDKDGPNGDFVFSATATGDAINATRNPYFRYQPMTRLDNLVTNQSNVYAVWVTIGFFEVKPADNWATNENNVQARFNNDQALYNRVYPDGYTFTREAGADTGEIRRVRGFYILDRTLPAGFEPGVDHNSQNIVRLRRHIE